MPGFFSPLVAPASWTLAPAQIVTPPPALRYAGYPLLGVRATKPGGRIAMPALGVVRRAGTGPLAIEIQVTPFPIRRVVQRLPFGCPTFYLLLADASGLAPFMDGDSLLGGVELGGAADVTIALAGQDRVARHPRFWAEAISAAITGAAGTLDTWEDFAAALAPAGEPPVIVLDHAGAPRTAGAVELDGQPVTLAPADAGDLQRALARIGGARTSVFGGAASATVGGAVGDHQLARLEGGATAADAIAVPSTGGHVTLTDLERWFAPQFAGPALARYTRGNHVHPFVNGPEFFDDLFRALPTAHGLHLTGWSMVPDAKLITLRSDDPAALPRTLAAAAAAIVAAGGQVRFLPSRHYQLDTHGVQLAEIVAFSVLTMGFTAAGIVGKMKIDLAGMVVLGVATIANAVIITLLLADGGRPLEPNGDAVDQLPSAVFSGYPATVADNPRAPGPGGFPWGTLFSTIDHFGVYHQKLALVQDGAGDVIAYCGGIDLNPDRLDDADHLHPRPFHDVHARFAGPAVRDFALTFAQRWQRDGTGDGAVTTPAAGTGATGSNAVQVARTYFKPAASARALAFAPQGDRTINDTLLRAITAAEEFIYIEDQYLTPPDSYRNALAAKVASGSLKRLVITVPAVADQPFGDLYRGAFIEQLRTADNGRGIVRVGYPRRHCTLTDNDLRASSGRLRLAEDLPAAGDDVLLFPQSRLPAPPFWLAIDGELMYVNDEARGSEPENYARFTVIRGSDTHLLHGGLAPAGPTVREHARGAPVSTVELASIYVHAKLMIVDDVFLSLGSANLNRRGLFHDGELNAFVVPEGLKAGGANPVRDLRTRLWAELLDLPERLAAPLLADPVAAGALLDRSPFLGNRYVDIDAHPAQVLFGKNGSDGAITGALGIASVIAAAAAYSGLFDGVVDPTSGLETP